jgi:hypothetical protein
MPSALTRVPEPPWADAGRVRRAAGRAAAAVLSILFKRIANVFYAANICNNQQYSK